MKCKYPIVTKNSTVPVPCGGCLSCRINDRRIRTHRMMLEANSHSNNSFLTLTYNDDNLPQEFFHEKTGQIYEQYSVNPDHHRKFINRFRTDYKRKTGKEISFYMCGEYGEKTQRPHYHYALFGFPSCLNLESRRNLPKFEPCNCRHCKFVSKHWNKGHIFLGDLTQHSAQYVAGYVTKKLTSDNTKFQNEILKGRHPEFARMSKNPALGKTAIIKHLERIKPYIKQPIDLPTVLTHNGKQWPLGRYLRLQMLIQMGWDEEDLSKSQKLRKDHDKVLSMFEGKTLTTFQKELISNGLPDAALRLLNAQRSLNLEEKEKIKQSNQKGF